MYINFGKEKNMDNQNRTNTQDEITLADIIRMFRGKAKILICVFLIAAIIGGAAGVFSAFISSPYGANIKFYLNPGANTQSLLEHLKSDAFAERLLLNEYGLPEKSEGYKGYAEAENAVKEMLEAGDDVIRLNKEYSNFNYFVSTDPNAKAYEKITLNEIEKQHEELVAKYEAYYALLEVYKNAYSDIVAGQESHIEKTKEYEDAVAKALKDLDDYRANYYYPKTEQYRALSDELNRVRADLKEKRIEADEKVEYVLAQWRTDPEVQSMVSLIRDSVTYKYATVVEDDSENNISNIDKIEQNTNYSFLEISVAVDYDRDTADEIIDKIKSNAPDFISLNLERFTGYTEVKCTLISTNAQADNIDQTSMLQNAVIYAAIAAIAATAIVCVAIIIKGMLPPDTLTKETKKIEEISKEA